MDVALWPVLFVVGLGALIIASGTAELAQVAVRIARLVADRGLSFFDRYRDLADLDLAVNVDRTPDFDISHDGSHARTAVILARLARNDPWPTIKYLIFLN